MTTHEWNATVIQLKAIKSFSIPFGFAKIIHSICRGWSYGIVAHNFPQFPRQPRSGWTHWIAFRPPWHLTASEEHCSFLLANGISNISNCSVFGNMVEAHVCSHSQQHETFASSNDAMMCARRHSCWPAADLPANTHRASKSTKWLRPDLPSTFFSFHSHWAFIVPAVQDPVGGVVNHLVTVLPVGHPAGLCCCLRSGLVPFTAFSFTWWGCLLLTWKAQSGAL